MVGISTDVKKRISKYYGRKVPVIYPPVNFENVKTQKREDYYLIVSRLVPYKRVDLAIEAFRELNLPLVIVGSGRQEQRLKKMSNKNIHFKGQLTTGELASYYEKCIALVHPQVEDFGIAAVEAQVHGTPVIALRAGGAKDTVIDGVTGIFFNKQDKKSLKKAIIKMSKARFDIGKIRDNAKRFSKEKFKKEFRKIIDL
jgi:glycosyltransferase involved in cell wall biosynthesis